MKYTIFFFSIAILLVWGILDSSSKLSCLLLWPVITAFVLGIAYSLNKPKFVSGKNPNGRLNVPLVIINLPWLLLTWLIWVIQKQLSNENAVDHIKGTNWFISSYPGLTYPSVDYDLIIDLTAEFPCPRNANSKYICIPNLDGVPLSNPSVNLKIDSTSKVLVHCAQGHGRSATWCSLALAKHGVFNNASSAYSAIKESRPGATASKSQERQISNVS